MKRFIFTFGADQKLEGYAQIIEAENELKAREIMNEVYGNKWAFCYTEEKWNEIKNDKNRFYPIEELLPTVLK